MCLELRRPGWWSTVVSRVMEEGIEWRIGPHPTFAVSQRTSPTATLCSHDLLEAGGEEGLLMMILV